MRLGMKEKATCIAHPGCSFNSKTTKTLTVGGDDNYEYQCFC